MKVKKALQWVGYSSLILASIFSVFDIFSDKILGLSISILLYAITIFSLVTYLVLDKKSK